VLWYDASVSRCKFRGPYRCAGRHDPLTQTTIFHGEKSLEHARQLFGTIPLGDTTGINVNELLLLLDWTGADILHYSVSGCDAKCYPLTLAHFRIIANCQTQTS